MSVKKTILVAKENQTISFGVLRAKLAEAEAAGVTDDATLTLAYDPSYLANELRIELPLDPESLTPEQLIAEFRKGDPDTGPACLDEIERRLTA